MQKCKACKFIEQHTNNNIIKQLQEQNYPVQDICISAYFEIEDDNLCFCFHNAHVGVLANFVDNGLNNKPSIDIIAPAVTYLDNDGRANVFLLRDFKDRQEKSERLYDRLKEVNSVAYALIEIGEIKRINKKDLRDINTDDVSEEDLPKVVNQLNEKGESIADVVSIRGQSLAQSLGYIGLAEVGNHNGIGYLKEFTFKKMGDSENIQVNSATAFNDQDQKRIMDDISKLGDKFQDINLDNLKSNGLNRAILNDLKFPDLKVKDDKEDKENA